MNSISAKCGHVKRRLLRNEPLRGKVLQFALELVGDGTDSSDDDLLGRIGRKLRSGETLDSYETHFMVDVVLLHTRLGGGLVPSPHDPVDRPQ